MITRAFIHLGILGLSLGTLHAAAPSPSDPASWSFAANHLHSSPGGEKPWPRGIQYIASWCERNGVTFAALTDHNTIEGWFLPEFNQNPRVVMLRGEEWTSTGGHANLIEYSASGPGDVIHPGAVGSCEQDEPGSTPARPAGDEPPVDHQAMVDQVHARGGLVLINHPGLPLYPWPEKTFGADGCEVGRNFLDFRGRRSFAWWLRRLEEGSKITAIAGSDFHFMRPKKGVETQDDLDPKGPIFTPAIDTPINLILAPTKDVAGFRTAILSRHVQVLRNRKAPKIFAAVEASGAEDFADGIAGDVITVKAGTRARIQVRVLGGRKQELEILESRVGGSEGKRKTTTVDIDQDDFTHEIQVTSSGDASSFVVLTVGGLESLANPIWY